MRHPALLLSLASLMLASCDFEQADYYEYRYGQNVDFGEDAVIGGSGSSFKFGSSYSRSNSGGRALYWGDEGNSNASNSGKKDYSRYYRGSGDD